MGEGKRKKIALSGGEPRGWANKKRKNFTQSSQRKDHREHREA
jgi:hypothetical protein